MHLLGDAPAAPPQAADAPLKPWQRLAALEFSNGTSFTDMEKMLGISYNEISGFITSPSGTKAVQEILRMDPERLEHVVSAAGFDSIIALIKVRDFGKNESARISAANSILERVLPRLQNRKDNKTTTQARIGESVEAEVERLRKELKDVS